MSEAGSRGRGQGSGERKRTGGFTLIEVLLAVSILAFIVSIVYASFSTVGNNVEQAETMRDNTDLARTLLIKMSDDVANAYLPATMTNQAVFYGKKEELRTGNGTIRHDSLNLTTLTNWRRLNSKETELWEVGYFFKEKEDRTGFVLMRREKRELTTDSRVLEGGTEYEITDKVTGLQFRYSTNGTVWSDEWDSRNKSNTLPKFVELGLTLVTEETYSMRVEIGRKILP